MPSPSSAAKDDSATDSDLPSAFPAGSDTESDTETETEDDLSCPPASSPFEVGEKVLASHSSSIYDARVLKSDYRFKEWKFFVHYMGWNKNWDEWIGLDRLMKRTEENIKKQEELNKKLGTLKNAMAWRVSQMKPRSPNVARGRKRKQDSIDKEKNAASSDKLVTFHIPPALRKQLIDDCEYVTHMKKLVKLPRSPNVDDILKKYVEWKTKKHGGVTDSVGEILKGLRCYFDKALPAMLLYKNERKQFEETISSDVSPSTVYGAEHLLRLFGKVILLHFSVRVTLFVLIMS
ncbi:PREDICTED: protein MRG2 isoform X2 [Tarenaya hassleriana]|uniref:protein MRG2 isoform X2 n=2 Tax=Tarenaya hassleriana TaxID=28532 RepID=UPI00053CA48E|nr:PREDICTED: protein MRG2 isoform X2 [Tarenaya hassleriana]